MTKSGQQGGVLREHAGFVFVVSVTVCLLVSLTFCVLKAEAETRSTR